MANIKFSAFTQKVALGDVDFLVGYTGADNVRVAPSVLSSVYLPLAGGNMTGATTHSDNVNTYWGNSNDLQIYHDSPTNVNYINSRLNRMLTVTASVIKLKNEAGTETYLTGTENGAVDLYYDNVKRFETSAGGVLVTGTLDATGTISVTGASSNIKVGTDTGKFMAGAGNDLQVYHDGNDSYITDTGTGLLFIRGSSAIRLQGANGESSIDANENGAVNLYYDNTQRFETTATGVNVTGEIFADGLILYDNEKAKFGNANDLEIYHSGTNSVISNLVGNLYISNHADDKDIIFECDDGAGGSVSYFKLDGSSTDIQYFKDLVIADNVKAKFGNSSDLQIYHDGSDSVIQNNVGDLEIQNRQDDGDIVFKSDDGAGGVETYFFLDGSASGGDPYTVFPDNSNLSFGTGRDSTIQHNGSRFQINSNGGPMYITQSANDGDLIFESDDGAGGTTAYITLDGSHTTTLIQKKMHFDDNIKLTFGNYATPDLEIYHDGSNSYISDTGTGGLRINSDVFRVLDAANVEVMIKAEQNAAVELYYDNSKKFETTSTGTLTTGQMDIAALNTAPASASAAGTLGEIRYTADYIYVCTATNTWKRTALSTW